MHASFFLKTEQFKLTTSNTLPLEGQIPGRGTVWVSVPRSLVR